MNYQRLLNRVLLVLAFLATLTALPAAARVYPVDPAGLARAIEAQERHTDQLMATVPDVVGTAVGVRADGKHVVKIFTETTGVAGLPRELDGIPVQVEVTGKIFARAPPCGTPPCGGGRGGGPGGGGEPTIDPTDRFPRPVPIGVSTGHPAITAGTICCRVTGAGGVYALSNNHVYANENSASIGDNVLQPGPFPDGGVDPDDAIGTLDDFEPIVFSTSANNVIDAAIASTTLLGNATPSDGYGTPQSTTTAASVRLRVIKYGRTTGQTKGRVTAVNATVNVGYDTGVARFVDQIVIGGGGFSAGGDSGSLIVVQGGPDNLKPVGLLFAGSSSVTIANPIAAVLGRFGVTVDGQ